MFRRFFPNKAQESLSGHEEAAIMRLASAHSRLVYDDCDRVDTQSEPGMASCMAFLDCLDQAAHAISADKAPRSYRSSFTKNYRTLFPDEERNYRVDVLDASVDQQLEMWVNGEKFEFSSETMQRAEALQRAWPELKTLFGRWPLRPKQDGSMTRPDRAEVCNVLVALDFAWAGFEQKYIIELIEIEAKARRLIIEAVGHARRLDALEAGGAGTGKTNCRTELLAEWHQEQARLVHCIANLNSVANNQRKGRDDLSVEILLDALAALRRCDAEEIASGVGSVPSASRMLANDVVDSFAGMRSYLSEVEGCLECVDPHLCNNAGLVERLLDWEESWELGSRYVQNHKLLHVLSNLVTEIRAAQLLAPTLGKMCEDCDVELFMVLPRIVWLHFFMQPKEHEELLASLLPHRFNQRKIVFDGHSAWDPELHQRVEHFEYVTRLLTKNTTNEHDKTAWQILMMRVVNGDCSRVGMSLSPQVETAVEKLMHELEGWSMELQRHCPEDWNQLSAVLVQCLAGEKSAQASFRV